MGVAIACTTYSVGLQRVRPHGGARQARLGPRDQRGGGLVWPVRDDSARPVVHYDLGLVARTSLACTHLRDDGTAWRWFARLGQEGALPQPTGIGQASAKEALSTAFTDRSYILLIFGYFVCGFQVVFIGAHLTPYLLDRGVPAHVGVTALALIGLFNVFGTYLAGVAAGRVPKRHVLALIYFMRSVVIVAFLALPLSPLTVYLFAAAIGFLWLSTVPPTNALVAQIYGARYLGTLGGIVFFSHQIGSFLGAWLGGKLFDTTGSYDIVWGIIIALGVFAALVHLPIDERALEARSA